MVSAFITLICDSIEQIFHQTIFLPLFDFLYFNKKKLFIKDNIELIYYIDK